MRLVHVVLWRFSAGTIDADDCNIDIAADIAILRCWSLLMLMLVLQCWCRNAGAEMLVVWYY